MILNGRELAKIVRQETSVRCLEYEKKYSRKPCLAVILVGNNPASLTYISGKQKACDEVGIQHKDYIFDENTSQKSLIELIKTLNNDDMVDGILVQLPLPKHIDENTVIMAINPSKDVDGFTPQNMGKMFLGQKSLVSCTPKGILRILDHYGIETQSKNVCVVGRSNIVGKPMAALLMQKDRNATVTVCNSFTKDIGPYVKNADILICAVGKPGIIDGSMVKNGATVIDVGINRVEDETKVRGYRLVGDLDFDSVSLCASAVTPVPGGVGPMTIAMLIENTVEAAFALRNPGERE